MSDAEVFGTGQRELSDAEVFGAPDHPPVFSPDGMPLHPAPTRQDVIDALKVPEGRYNALMLPVTADEGTGAHMRLSLPGIIRSPLLGLAEGPQGAVTINPDTGTMGLTPEAQSVASFGANPLRFGGASPSFVPPGTLDRRAPLSAEFRANPLAPELASRPLPAPGGPVVPTGVPSQVPAIAAPRSLVPRTSAEAKQVASAYYDLADKNGGTLAPQVTDRFVDSVTANLPQTEAGKAVLGQSAVSNLVDRLQAIRGQPMTLRAAQDIDEGLSNLIDKEFTVKGLSKEGRNLVGIQDAFRGQIENAGAEDIIGGASGFDALAPARKAWAQAMKMGDLERIQQRAELTDNPATSIKSGIRTLLSNPTRVRGYSPEEIAALKAAADRGTLGGILHVFGSRLTPLAAAAVGGTSGGLVGGVIAGGAAQAVSSGMRNAATAMQTRRLNNAMTILGRGVPQNPLAPP